MPERQGKSHQRIVIDLMTQLLYIIPRGTPHEIFEMLTYLFSVFNKNARSVRYEWNQLSVSSLKPTVFNFYNSILWLILSNSFWRSISIIPVRRPSKPFKILTFKYVRHKSVECFVLKLDWRLYKMSYCG